MQRTLRDRAESVAVSLEGHARAVLTGNATEEQTAAMLTLGGATIRLLLPMFAAEVDDDDDERPASKSRRDGAKAKTKPANSCTDGKRHKYVEEGIPGIRVCKKCGSPDPRGPKPDQRTGEIPGVA